MMADLAPIERADLMAEDHPQKSVRPHKSSPLGRKTGIADK